MIQLNAVSFENFVPNWRRSLFVSTIHIIVLNVHGNVVYDIDGSQLTMAKGDVLITHPGTTRSGSNGPYPPHQKYSAHFALNLPENHPIHKLCTLQGYQLFKTRKFEYFRQRFSMLYRNWIDKSPLYEFTCQGMVMELFGSLLLELTQQQIPANKQLIATEIETYIQSHFKEEITITQLAELVNLSPNYVTSIFKEVTGQTPIEYVHQLRSSIARDLLLSSDMKISEISDYLGFCEPTYFHRIFKKVMGLPPSALLKQRNSVPPAPIPDHEFPR
jgi:AraC-like DNA-binding protein